MKRKEVLLVILIVVMVMSACKKQPLLLSDNGKAVLQNAYVDLYSVYVPPKPIEEYVDCRAKILSSFTPEPDAKLLRGDHDG